MKKVDILAQGFSRYEKMITETPDYLQGVVDRYGELLFKKINALPFAEQAAVFRQAREKGNV